MPIANYRVSMITGSGRNQVVDDLTPYTLEASWRRGRDNIDTLIGVTKASVVRILVKNKDGRFDPENKNSPLFGRLLPWSRIIIEGRVNRNYPWTRLATANIDRVQGRNYPNGNRRAQIICFGIFAFLESQNARINLTDLGLLSTGQIVLLALQSAFRRSDLTGLNTHLWDIDPNTKTNISGHYLYSKGITGGFRNTPTALSAMRYLEKIEPGFLWEDVNNRVVFYGRQRRWAERRTINAEFVEKHVLPLGPPAPLEPVDYHFADPRENWEDIRNVFRVNSATVQTGQAQPLYRLPSVSVGLAIQPNQTIRLVCSINQEVTRVDGDTNLREVLTWNRPTFSYSSDQKGDNVLNTGVLLGSIVEQDTDSCVVALTNYDRNPVYLQNFTVTGVPVRHFNSFGYEEVVAESIALYGQREWRFPVEIIRPFGANSDNYTQEAKDHLGYLATIYSRARQHLMLEYSANKSDWHLFQALNREIQDRILVTNRGLGVDRLPYILEFMEHTIKGNGSHAVKYGLSTTSGVEPWATVGDSETYVGGLHDRVGF